MKKKYYLTLDTETATLPFVNRPDITAADKSRIALSKPLVYDIGWVITDRNGNIVKFANFLVEEIFLNPDIFSTAYYKKKHPIYTALLEDGQISIAKWNDIVNVLLADLQSVDIATAYNATFDFKKAIPFTERYIKHLYSTDYAEWLEKQYEKCMNAKTASNPDFMSPYLELREQRFPFADLWSVACYRLININRYKNYCLKNFLLTDSVKFFQTSAEIAFQYLMQQDDFLEDHTALSDALIESQILTKALKKGKVEAYLKAFPFQNLGTSFEYVQDHHPTYKKNVIRALQEYIDKNDGATKKSSYWKSMVKTLEMLKSK